MQSAWVKKNNVRKMLGMLLYFSHPTPVSSSFLSVEGL